MDFTLSFRSEEMKYFRLVMSKEVSRKVMASFGNRGSVQLIDLNEGIVNLDREKKIELGRLEDLDRTLGYLQQEMRKLHIEWDNSGEGDIFEGRVKRFLDEQIISEGHRDIAALLKSLKNVESKLKLLGEEGEMLTNNLNEKQELAQVYRCGTSMLHQAEDMAQWIKDNDQMGTGSFAEERTQSDAGDIPLLATSSMSSYQSNYNTSSSASNNTTNGQYDDLGFNYIAGVVSSEQVQSLRAMVFRATRGNSYSLSEDIPQVLVDPSSGDFVNMSLFLIYFKGENVQGRIRRVCQAFDARLYDVDLTHKSNIVKQLTQTENAISDQAQLLRKNKMLRRALLRKISPEFTLYKWKLERERALVMNLNKLRVRASGSHSEMLEGEGWCLAKDFGSITSDFNKFAGYGLGNLTEVTNKKLNMEGLEGRGDIRNTPPTHFETNYFTSVFQGVVSTYGIPRYQEANPALFTIVTFPFEFGVMFGDLGHGFMIFVVSLLMCIYERQIIQSKPPEMVQMIFAGRYMLVVMGFFATYCGLIYNDMFSLTLNLFGTQWKEPTLPAGQNFTEGMPYVPVLPNTDNKTFGVYSFGFDPRWHKSGNELLFLNSYKMKNSVVIGVTQMIFGLLLKGMNCIYFGHAIEGFAVVIPQLIFAVGIFGYMIFLIFLKWTIPWGHLPVGDDREPPMLIQQLIGMALKVLTPSAPNPKFWMWKSQDSVQTYLFGFSMLMVPTILLLSPILQIYVFGTHHGHGDESGHGTAEEKKSLLDHNGASTNGSMSSAMLESGSGGTHAFHEDDDLMFPERKGDKSTEGEKFKIQPSLSKDGAGATDHDDEGGHSTGDIWVHACIETIEFVLSMVSNTASYLRLWALSLAHAELSK
eukprot:g2089.t1